MRSSRLKGSAVVLACIMGVWGCASRPQTPPPRPTEVPKRPEVELRIPIRVQEGVASWYGPGFHGSPTSSGETYDMFQMTAAHQTLPLGTRVLVTNLENSRSVEVVINDRGPFVKDRVIDLSYSAARVLGIVGPGTARVRLEVIEDPPGGPIADFAKRPVYTLQLGAFSESARALSLKGELDETIGPGSVRIEQVKVGGQDLHRVRLGRFEDRREALARAEQLARRGYTVLVVEERQ